MDWNETRERLIKCGVNDDALPDEWEDSINLRGANLYRADLSRADLRRANLGGADLSGANLSWANLGGANLYGADLYGANLYGADLYGADLRRADLYRANLGGADLSGADLSWANLGGTVLTSDLSANKRRFSMNCKPKGRNGGRIVYRSNRSQHNGSTEYNPGKTYIAPVFSHDPLTECHPGIYACDTPDMASEWSNIIVKCYVRDGDYIVVKKGIRCSRLRVLEIVS